MNGVKKLLGAVRTGNGIHFHSELPGEALSGNSGQDRAFRMAGLNSWSRRGLLALVTGESGHRAISGAADHRRAAVGTSRRHGWRDREAPIEEPLTSIGSAWGHLRGEIDAAQSLVRIWAAYSASRWRAHVSSSRIPPGAVDRSKRQGR